MPEIDLVPERVPDDAPPPDLHEAPTPPPEPPKLHLVETPVPAMERLKADLGRYFEMAGAQTFWKRLRLVAETESTWVVATYRVGQWLQEEAPKPVRLALKIPHALVHRTLQMALGIHLFPATRIGPGLYIGHSGGIWISPHAELGANCNVNHAVTIGVAGRGRGAPKLGNAVWVGPGAIVSGPVKIGDGAVIGANSLVATHVPKDAVVIGVPARVISRGGSGRLVR